jgi:hypothetical protein
MMAVDEHWIMLHRTLLVESKIRRYLSTLIIQMENALQRHRIYIDYYNNERPHQSLGYKTQRGIF